MWQAIHTIGRQFGTRVLGCGRVRRDHRTLVPPRRAYTAYTSGIHVLHNAGLTETSVDPTATLMSETNERVKRACDL
jgi:hypothetical protein